MVVRSQENASHFLTDSLEYTSRDNVRRSTTICSFSSNKVSQMHLRKFDITRIRIMLVVLVKRKFIGYYYNYFMKLKIDCVHICFTSICIWKVF